MAAVHGGLNVLTKTFRATAFLQRCLRPSTCSFGSLRWLATEKKHKMKLDERPKKPPPPLFVYQMSVREKLAKENPGKKLPEITKLATAQYKELSHEKKEEFRLQYEERLAEYKKAYTDFLAGCTQEEIHEIQEEKKTKRENRKKRKLRAEKRQMEKPKMPTSSFFHFLLERRQYDINNDPEKMKNIKVAEYAKEVGAVWKKMSDSEKQPYTDKFKKEQAEYERQLEMWEAEMVKQDKMHLVRVGHQAQAEDASKKKTKKKVTSKKTASSKRTAKKKTKTRSATKKKSAATKKKETTEQEHELSDSESE